MHAVAMETLDEYLAGALNPAKRKTVEAHLTDCESCRERVEGLREISGLFEALRSEEAFDASPGFYAGVMRRVETQASAAPMTGLLTFDLLFARRMAFSCLLMLTVLGSFLLVRETSYHATLSPEAIMAQQNSPAFGSGQGDNNMLITLTSYER
jgi:anti-sigma factor RsiW